MALTDVVHHAVLTKVAGAVAFITVIFSLHVGCSGKLQSMDVSFISDNLELASNIFNFTLGCQPEDQMNDDEKAQFLGGEIVKVGLTATLTNASSVWYEAEIRGLLLGLKAWQAFVIDDSFIHFKVLLCVQNDEGNLTKSMEFYRNFTEDEEMQVLLGPSNRSFHAEIAKIANCIGVPAESTCTRKTILLWAPEASHYGLPWQPSTMSSLIRGAANPLWGTGAEVYYERSRQPTSSELGARNILKTANEDRRLKSTGEQSGPKNQDSETEVLNIIPDMRNTTAPARRTYAWNENSGIFDQGYKYVFEIGVNPDRWLLDVFTGLKQDRQSAGVIILDVSETTSCSEHVTAVTTQAGFDNVTLVKFYDPYSLPDLLFQGGWLTIGQTYTWAMCGNALNLFYTMQILRAMNFMPPSVVFVTPGMISKVSEETPIEMMHYVMEPRPLGFLGENGLYFTYIPGGCSNQPGMDFAMFDELFKSKIFVDEWPTLTTVLISSAWSALSAALCSPRTRLDAEGISAALRSINNLPSWTGLISFDQQGRCETCVGGAHQLLPLTQSYMVTDEITIYNSYKIVISNYSSIQVPEKTAKAYAYMVVPSPNWRSKELEIFSCDPGCVRDHTPRDYHGIPTMFRHTYCETCPPGKVRSDFQLRCTECNYVTGYADERGLSACKACPEGASCVQGEEARTPIALPAYYRYEKPGMNQRGDWCGLGFEPEERYMFIHCISEERCLGGNQCAFANTGFLCAQCIPGYSFQGHTPNARRCEKCPDNYIIALRFYTLFLLYFILLVILSQCSARAARDTSNLTVPILLSLLRHFQMLGILLYTNRIEDLAGPEFHVYTIPYVLGLFLTQPVNLLKLDCLWVNSAYPELPDNMGKVRGMFFISLAFGCSGYLLILVQFLIAGMCRYVCFHVRAHRARSRASKQSFQTKQEMSCFVAQRHEVFMKVKKDLANCERMCYTWSILVFPMLLMNCILSVMCVSKDLGLDKPRLYINLDVLCNEGEHQAFATRSLAVYVLVGFCIPLVLLIPYYQVWRGSAYWHLGVRRSSGLLHSGYKLSYFYFEIFFFLRFAILMVPLWSDDVQTRDTFLIVIQALFIFFYEANPPRTSNDRFALGILDRCSYITLIIGSLMVMCLTNPTAEKIIGWSSATSWILDYPDEVVAGACALSSIFLVYAFHCLIYNRILIPLHIYRKTGGKLNCFQICFLKLFTFFHGFHSIRVASGDSMDFRLDLGHIFGSERSFLLTIMQETLQACMDSVNHLDMAMIVAAFNESFLRAGKNREIRVNLDVSGGTDTTHKAKVKAKTAMNVALGMGQSRSTQSTASVRREDTGVPHRKSSASSGPILKDERSASGISKVHLSKSEERAFDLTQHGISVDELYAAFQHVAVDVITHEPSLHQMTALIRGDANGLKPHNDEVIDAAQSTTNGHSPVETKRMIRRSDQDRMSLKSIDKAFSPMGKGIGSFMTWGELEDFLTIQHNVSQLEAIGLTPYDCMKAFVLLSGTSFLNETRTGKTGVDHTYVNYTSFTEGCLYRIKLQKRRLREVSEVERAESRAETFSRNHQEIHKFFSEETYSMAVERGLEMRCEEAKMELAALRDQLNQKARSVMRAQEVTNQAAAPREGTELYRLLGGSLQPTMAIDKDSVLSRWAKEQHLTARAPQPTSIVSPRARGVEWNEWKEKALESGLVDPDDPSKLAETHSAASTGRSVQPRPEMPEDGRLHDELARTSRNRFAQAEASGQFDLQQAMNLPTGALSAAAAIMSAAMSRPIGDAGYKPKPKTKAKAAGLPLADKKTEENAQDALEFCFDVPRAQVHEDVFKAMLLGQFRAHGVSQAAIVGLYMKYMDADKLTVDVYGPATAINELRNRDLFDLKVMGHKLKYIEEPQEKRRPANFKPAPRHAQEVRPGQDVIERNAVAKALSELRFVDAARHAAKMEEIDADLNALLGTAASERVSNAKLRYEECLQMLEAGVPYEIKGDWTKEETGLGLKAEFGCSVGGPSAGSAGSLFAVLVEDFDNCDPLRAFIALQELDIDGAILGPLQGVKWANAKRLDRRDIMGESVWHILNEVEELKLKEDNVWRVSAIDALAEPIGCLMVAAHSTKEPRMPLMPDVPLPSPRPESGEVRARGAHSVCWIIKPTRAGQPGFRLVVASRLKLNAQQYGMLWMMPAWGLSRTVRPLMHNFSKRFRELIQRPQGKGQSAKGDAPKPDVSKPDALKERMAHPRWRDILKVLKERFDKVFDSKDELEEGAEDRMYHRIDKGDEPQASARTEPENVTPPVSERGENWNFAEAINSVSPPNSMRMEDHDTTDALERKWFEST